MAKIVIIGGSGHVGTYLVPRLVEAGHDVTNVSRGAAKPYLHNAAWNKVNQVILDREAAEKAGTFADTIASFGADIVIDMICFDLVSAEQLVEALAGKVRHFIHIGTIWVHGYSVTTPTCESDPRDTWGEYGVQKLAIEDYLIAKAHKDGFPATIVRPGHIVGPGWAPVNPQGNGNPNVFKTIAAGEPLALPNFGLETVHHVHADDVAQLVMLALAAPSVAKGEAFNAVSSAAISLRGFASAMFNWFGQPPNLTFAPFDEWAASQSAEDAEQTLEHISRSPCHSHQKATRLLGYHPRYTSLEAVKESVVALLGK